MIEMNLMEAERNPNGQRQLTPSLKQDKALFEHVCGGYQAVTESAFFDIFLPVFQAHNVKCTLPTDFVLGMRAAAAMAKGVE